MATLTTAATTQEKLLRARAASSKLALLSTEEKNSLLLAIADAMEAHEKEILSANQQDIKTSGLEGAMRDRLTLTSARIKEMAQGVRDVAGLPDPIGETLAEWTKENGLRIRKVRVPIGVVGIIYESRPNVTVDTAVIALKTGNAIVLRGGKEAVQSNQCLVEIMSAVPGVPEGAIELLDSSSRQSVHDLIKARGLVDVIVPRGGAGLITFVTENSTVPVIETGAGNCHIFVDATGDFDMADRIVINAKTQRPSVCNAAEKLLVHQSVAAEYIPRIVKKLIEAGVEVRGDNKARALAQGQPVSLAPDQDWYEEYLRLCMADRGRRRRGRRHRAHQQVLDQALRFHHHRRRIECPQVSEGCGFRRRLLERLHPLHRRSRIRLRRRDGHQHPETPLPRPLRPAGTDFFEVRDCWDGAGSLGLAPRILCS